MWEFFSNVATMWPLIFFNGLVDYASANFISGPVSQLPGGPYLASGLNFTMKQAAARTSYITGWSLGSMGLMGGSGAAGPTTH